MLVTVYVGWCADGGIMGSCTELDWCVSFWYVVFLSIVISNLRAEFAAVS